jgi:hypothetical protein
MSLLDEPQLPSAKTYTRASWLAWKNPWCPRKPTRYFSPSVTTALISPKHRFASPFIIKTVLPKRGCCPRVACRIPRLCATSEAAQKNYHIQLVTHRIYVVELTVALVKASSMTKILSRMSRMTPFRPFIESVVTMTSVPMRSPVSRAIPFRVIRAIFCTKSTLLENWHSI